MVIHPVCSTNLTATYLAQPERPHGLKTHISTLPSMQVISAFLWHQNTSPYKSEKKWLNGAHIRVTFYSRVIGLDIGYLKYLRNWLIWWWKHHAGVCEATRHQKVWSGEWCLWDFRWRWVWYGGYFIGIMYSVTLFFYIRLYFCLQYCWHSYSNFRAKCRLHVSSLF